MQSGSPALVKRLVIVIFQNDIFWPRAGGRWGGRLSLEHFRNAVKLPRPLPTLRIVPHAPVAIRLEANIH